MRTRIILAILALCGVIESKAQLSVGADIALPMGDFGDVYSLGVGPSLGLDLNITEVFTVFGQASYDFLMVKSDFSDVISSSYMIPYQAGLKVYLSGDSQGLYGMGMFGGHTLGSKVSILGNESSDSNTLFSWGLGGGFRTGKLDFGVRYNAISKDKESASESASSYVGLRVGFFLSGD